MEWQLFQNWLGRANLLLLGIILFATMGIAATLGTIIRGRWSTTNSAESGQEGYIVSAVLGLLALLMGFTFSLAVDRFDARRLLVLQEANAIGTTYLRAQLLAEPDRSRMTHLLVRYTDNRIALAKARPGDAAQLLAVNDALLTDIWAATDAAFEGIKGLPFSSTYLDSVNALIDLDASRKMARAARVPPEVFGVLIIYMVMTAGVLGYVLKGVRGRLSGAFLLALLTLSLVLVLDIDRPIQGAISESQLPMEQLRAALASQPPSVFDKFRPDGR